jgi:hypothetical protein
LYERARVALAAKTNDKKQGAALEWAIHAVEKSPHEMPGTRGSTWLPALSMLIPFAPLWVWDATCMSVYWVVRPWNKNFMPEAETEPFVESQAMPSAIPPTSGGIAGSTSTARPAAARLNTKRLALSLSIAGAIVVPLWTGSLMHFITNPVTPAGVWYETVNKKTIDAQIICDLSHKKDDCDKADRLQEQLPKAYIEHPYSASLNLRPLVGQIALGAVVPAFFVLIIPSIIRRYFRWLMS